MSDKSQPEQPQPRIHGLTGPWEVAVRIVGTFGLAVFLVLYYVLIMQPRDQARYDELRQSVESLIKVVESGQMRVTRDQGNNLEELYVLAAAPEMAQRIERAMSGEPQPTGPALTELQERLQNDLENMLVVRADLLRGLTRKDGGSISEMLTNKVRTSRIAERVVERTMKEWPMASGEELTEACKESLYFAFRELAMAK